MDVPKQKRQALLSRRERIEILLEEYRSLNSLLLFRLAAMDRRLPVSIGLVVAAIASALAIPVDARIAVLLITPPTLFWLVRSTVQHARAKEDHLRRIDEIEQAINLIAGEDLLVFQSQHPNQARIAAGRTGGVTVIAVCTGALAMLAFCVFLFLSEPNAIPQWIYLAYVTVFAIDAIAAPFVLSRYRYRKPTVVAPSARFPSPAEYHTHRV